jgi:hypothetical protein
MRVANIKGIVLGCSDLYKGYNRDMKTKIALLCVLILLAGCGRLGGEVSATGQPLSSTAVASPSPTPFQAPPTGEASPTAAATPTGVPPGMIITDYPLVLHAAWVYSAEIKVENPNDQNNPIQWNGTLTETIIGEESRADGTIVFSIQRDMWPAPPPELWTQPGIIMTRVQGDGVYSGAGKIYQWPLLDGAAWDMSPEGTGYFWQVTALALVQVPYGELHNCFTLTLGTNPDTTVNTFCPGVGFVEHVYFHHGSLYEEHFVLVEFRAGK